MVAFKRFDQSWNVKPLRHEPFFRLPNVARDEPPTTKKVRRALPVTTGGGCPSFWILHLYTRIAEHTRVGLCCKKGASCIHHLLVAGGKNAEASGSGVWPSVMAGGSTLRRGS